MNIRDIINAATPGPWKWGEYDQLESFGETIMFPSCACGGYKFERSIEDMAPCDGNKKFIATFDPQHIALMEAVIEAGDSPISGPQSRMALDTYRKERGLDE